MLSEKQIDSLGDSTAWINIWHGSVRSGKTWVTIYRWIHYAMTGPPGDLVMVGKTERTLKRNIIHPMQEILGNRMVYNRGEGEIKIGNRRIYVVGANDERSVGKIQGGTYAGGYGDELTLWLESFFRMLISRFSVSGAQFFGTTNPDGPSHWLKKDYMDRESDLSLRSFHFRLEDNPYLPDDYVANLKKSYSGLWYKRYIDGLWVLADGVIYDMVQDHHFVPIMPATFHNFIVGVDYGTNNPCTFGLYAWNDPGKIYLIREYWWDSAKEGRQKTDSQYADDMDAFLKDIRPHAIYVDPSAASFKVELQRRNKWNVKDANNDVLDGIRFVSAMFSNNQFFIHESCTHTRENYESYVWDSKAQDKGEDKPLKTNDHACFVAGTLITTLSGDVPIECVSCDDMVLTRNGYRKVLGSWQTSPSALVADFEVIPGKILRCTPDHRIITQNGKKPIESLTENDMLCIMGNNYKSQNAKELSWLLSLMLLCSMESNIADIQNRKTCLIENILDQLPITLKMDSDIYIKKFGNFITEPFQRIITFIIGMEIQPIIKLRILSFLIPRLIYHGIALNGIEKTIRKILKFLIGFVLLPLNGTDRKREENGIGKLEANHLCQPENLEKKYVPHVERNLLLLMSKKAEINSVLTHANQHTVGLVDWTISKKFASFVVKNLLQTNMQKISFVQSPAQRNIIGINQGMEPVYNLSVEENHEYFANGVLVSNCDRDRYAIFTHLHKTNPIPAVHSRPMNLKSASMMGRKYGRF